MKQYIQLAGFIVLGLLVLTTGYFFYAQNQKNSLLLEQLQQNNSKQIADLNDRLVAVARQQTTSTDIDHQSVTTGTLFNRTAQLQLSQQQQQLSQLQHQWTLAALQLVQQRLNEADYRQAQQLLLQLEQNISVDARMQPDSLHMTLLQTLKIDQLNIRQTEERQHQYQQAIEQVLVSTQQQLNQLATQQPADLLQAARRQPESGGWWKNLLIVQRTNVQTARQQLDQPFIYKQASLNLAMARLALRHTSMLDFNQDIQEAIRQLELLSNPDSRQILQQLNKISSQPLAERIQLTSLTLLAGNLSEKGNSSAKGNLSENKWATTNSVPAHPVITPKYVP